MLEKMIKTNFMSYRQWKVCDDPKNVVKALHEHLEEEATDEELKHQIQYLDIDSNTKK